MDSNPDTENRKTRKASREELIMNFKDLSSDDKLLKRGKKQIVVANLAKSCGMFWIIIGNWIRGHKLQLLSGIEDWLASEANTVQHF